MRHTSLPFHSAIIQFDTTAVSRRTRDHGIDGRRFGGPDPVAATLLLLLLITARLAGAAPGDVACSGNSGDTALWFSPRTPQPGETLRILAVSATDALDEITVISDEGASRRLSPTMRGGPPWSVEAVFDGLDTGHYTFQARSKGAAVACAEFTARRPTSGAVARGWDRQTEAFYAAWIEKLFDAPPGENLSFPSLEPVLRNAERNFLHGHLGWDEDRRLPAEPDCADLPYFLRTYFAWKVGLPMSFRACSRGSAAAPPQCGAPIVETGFTGQPAPTAAFQRVARRLVDTVHSGSARTGLSDNQTDFYPVPLQRESLWPGTVYADPYGHVLILVKWLPQTAGQSGLLLAVDAQPDNSVTRKRFWEGTFLFAGGIRSAGPGFKAFRPLAVDRDGAGPARLLSNLALLDDPRFPPYSAEQRDLGSEDFYARMNQLINPRGLDPEQAYTDTLEALLEQVQTRIESVENGETYRRKNPKAVISMPSGAAIFETIGAWEDYATPSRDMRLLIAMNVLAGVPERILRYPELYRLEGRSPGTAQREIETLHERSIAQREITYHRSDGSAWTLTLADLFARQRALEAAYNPNDCVELRWGADPSSAEASTCRSHAPADQRAKMEQYRAWFHETRRPPR